VRRKLMSSEEKLQVLQDLHGRQLGAVVFVQDYLQLQFDGSTLTITTWPVVHRDGEVVYGEPRYRDALCDCIAKVVEVADVVERDRLRIVFGDGSKLIISLKDADRVDPEAVRLNQEDGQWSVW
jgi:hypothetical protein